MEPLNIPGIGNGYKVDSKIWRGAQPPDEAWPQLAAAGCRAVVDLNNSGKERDRQAKLVESAGMKFYGLDWSGALPPRDCQVRLALTILDSTPGPVFVHCLHGSDRTGTLCACWRIHRDGYSLDTAIGEAFTALGLQGMHEFWMAAAVAEYAHNYGAK